jgi:methanogenic corrinoid protein MtbC1
VVQFLRETGRAVPTPQVLGLPSLCGKGDLTIEKARAGVTAALKSGDSEQFARLAFDLYLEGQTLCDICDKVVAPAFHAIGECWQHGEVEVYEERRGCEICLRTLHELRRVLPPPPAAAPHALGGTLEDDPYSIPTTMVELALREAGWRAESYGTGLPVATLCAAMDRMEPRLLWLCVSTFADRDSFLARYSALYEAAAARGIPVVVGGRALTEEVRREIRYSAYCDTLAHLVSFAKTLQAPVASQK